MKVVKNDIKMAELKEMAKNMHGNLVKVMVDIEKEVIVLDAPLHSDLMEFLIERENSEPKNLWGINLYPEKQQNAFIEFDSMMNLKPGLGNMTRGIENDQIREKIISIVNTLIKK